MSRPDLTLHNHGSLWLVRAESDAGHAWLDETAPEDAQFFGGSMVVEPRYINDVFNAAREAGLEVA